MSANCPYHDDAQKQRGNDTSNTVQNDHSHRRSRGAAIIAIVVITGGSCIVAHIVIYSYRSVPPSVVLLQLLLEYSSRVRVYHGICHWIRVVGGAIVSAMGGGVAV